MAKKGIYQKYECVATTIKVFVEPTTGNWSETTLADYQYFYLQYAFDEIHGYYGVGQTVNVTTIGYENFYVFSGTQDLSQMTRFSYTGRKEDDHFRIFESYTRVSKKENHTDYSRGTYLTDIIADYGALPADGRHTDGYWYVFVKMASDLKTNVSGLWKDVPIGFANVNGIWKPQSEFNANINGIYK